MAGIPGVSRATATYHAPSQDDRVIGRSMESAPSTLEKNIPNYGPPTVDGFHGAIWHKNHLLTKVVMYRHSFHLKARGHEKGTKKCLNCHKVETHNHFGGGPFANVIFQY